MVGGGELDRSKKLEFVVVQADFLPLSLSFGDEEERRRGRCRLSVCLHLSQASAP